MPLDYDSLPEELYWTPQWCVASQDVITGKYRIPSTVHNGHLRAADPTDPRTWCDMQEVRDFVEAHPVFGLGFVLSPTDPYTCIDLDIKNANNEPDKSKWTSQADIERCHHIIATFNSYTERSASAQGYHIWVRGRIGQGVRRGNVEVYSQQRFIVCTGDVVLANPIEDRQDLLDMLVGEMRRGQTPVLTLVETEQTETDETLFSRASFAENGSKFIALCEGRWAEGGYPSQSEADAALLTMLAFYSKSNSQVIRMFRATELGKRAKAVRNDYYLNTSLTMVRSVEATENLSTQVGRDLAAALLAKVPQGATPGAPGAPWPPIAPAIAGAAPPAAPQQPYKPAPIHTSTQPAQPVLGSNTKDNFGPLTYPPGFVGEVAKFIFSTSPRPIVEVSVVAALGLFAGICGRAFTIPQSGLNLYIILAGRSAIGKEAMHSGISKIIHIISNSMPEASRFVDFSDFVSAPALTKAVAINNSFVNVAGEFGKKLQRMSQSENGQDTGIHQLRTVMTNLYQKSGPGSVFGGLGYSDKEKDVASVSGVAYSMIGETTPGTLYDSLTDTMMADGFLSRFTIVEYTGDRPEVNPNMDQTMDPVAAEHLRTVMHFAATVNASASDPTLVQPDPEARQFLENFDKQCDTNIRGTTDEGWRQMWNRAHLKVYRLSAILAVADNHLFPVIGLHHVTWAHDLIMRDISIMSRRIVSGEVGLSDATRENKILAICAEYLTSPAPVGNQQYSAMLKDGIIARKFIQSYTQRISSFVQHRLGQVASMDMTIRSLVDAGYIQELAKAESLQKYSFHGKCYRILNLPDSLGRHKQQFSRAQA